MPLDFSSFFAYTMSMELKQLFNKCYGKEWDKASIFEKIEAVVVLIISFQFVSPTMLEWRLLYPITRQISTLLPFYRHRHGLNGGIDL